MQQSLDAALSIIADPTTATDALYTLAQDQPNLHAQIALHPNADAGLLDLLDKDTDPIVRASVAAARRRLSPVEQAKPAPEPTPTHRPDFIPAEQPVEHTEAIGRGKRCGVCGTFLNRQPGDQMVVCPFCGAENSIPQDSSRPSLPQDWRFGDLVPGADDEPRPYENGVGIAALIFGAASIICLVAGSFFSAVFSAIALLMGLGGVVCGIVNLVKISHHTANNRGITILGICLSAVIFVILILGLLESLLLT